MIQTPNIGDIVELNSGSPPLTVTGHGSQNGVFVTWINQDGIAQRESFPQACLKKYEAPKPAPIVSAPRRPPQPR